MRMGGSVFKIFNMGFPCSWVPKNNLEQYVSSQHAIKLL